MAVLETERLSLRRLAPEDDAAFVVELLNDPSFLRNIGDRGVRNEEDARRYLRDGPMASYAAHGYGLYLVAMKETGMSAGICGLVRRAYLDAPDLGFAFLPGFRRRGVASESASAVMSEAFGPLGLDRVLAIVSPHNADSIRVLEKLGFRSDGLVTPPGERDAIRLFVAEPPELVGFSGTGAA
jgi:ribosomal-protein-alanine N-acetyltransferase